MNNKIEKQSVPIFIDEKGMPIAGILYVKGQRIIFLLKTADEDELIALFEKKDKLIKENG